MSRPERSSITRPCACGQAHTEDAWSTATAGLFVVDAREACPNLGPEYGPQGWDIWQPATGFNVASGFQDPESAMHRADLFGPYQDWEDPDATGPTFAAIYDDLDRRGIRW